ncbi:MAG: ATP-binding cassette domain-containing protein [Synergistaceae bacterium]|jgi:ABC-2 type transport system ATP-binding protein|nr:ATP-binding cassette domain-containing protein [Synergistaceae bacterium]
MEATFALLAENISKSFKLNTGRTLKALDGVSVSAKAGGLTALVGPDGAGKTTFLRIVVGLLKPEGGTLSFPSMPTVDIGYMPQQFGLYEDLSVQENMDLYADLHGVMEREERYSALLAMSGMEGFRERLAGDLSGGMKQKLGLICTLIQPPKLLLLDEPTVGVDPLSRRELWKMIEQLSGGSEGMSVIISTSYMDEAEKCGEVALFFEGKVLASGPPESIRRMADGMGHIVHPAAGDTPRSLGARLLSARGVIDAVPKGGAVRFVSDGPLADEGALRGAKVESTPVGLEDGFMLLLHKTASGSSQSQDQPDDQPPKKKDETRPPPHLDSSGEFEIETQHVFRYFGSFAAVNDVSFSVRKGEVFGLLGPNGAGKTTTFRMLCGLLSASKGSLRVAGVDVGSGTSAARKEARRHIGYVAQKFALYGPLSVRENLEFFAGAYGLRGKERDRRVMDVTVNFSLRGQMDTAAGDLPGGYKRRLAMAAALMHEPSVLFLDEPTSGADPLARREFWRQISDIAEHGVTVVVTTHFMEEAEYCDRVMIQDRGRMLAIGTPAELRARVASPDATMEDAFIDIVTKARTNDEADQS